MKIGPLLILMLLIISMILVVGCGPAGIKISSGSCGSDRPVRLMTSPGRKGLPTIEPGCVEGTVEIGVGGVGLVGDAVRVGVVFPAGPHPTTSIMDIISSINISRGPIFIIVSFCLLTALNKYT